MAYTDTDLWKRTLGSSENEVEKLRNVYEKAKDNAGYMLSKIRNDFPNLTVHDLDHVDSLWNVADTIIGPDYEINPLEGFVLGVSFLIHDSVLSYDAFGGKETLRKTVEWGDEYAEGGKKDEEEFLKECDFLAMRLLHARKAEGILSQQFTRNDNSNFYIIEDESIRYHFGEMIGRIAASHHWDIDCVKEKLKSQKKPRAIFGKKWNVNEQKIACILRCADAGDISDRRAPDRLYYFLDLNGVSKNHWMAQNRLSLLCECSKDNTLLQITSTKPFSKEEFDAWNVAYEAVRAFDNELKLSNELLKPDGLSFPHVGVIGAESREALSEYIEADNWKPCDLSVHTSNVRNLITSLGGSKLYGKNNQVFVALRELIQNARDAIVARQFVEPLFSQGEILIREYQKDEDYYIEVIDNGVGMSLDCIKNNLLNFGSSYWKSSLSKRENPGLKSKFHPIGKYGIGFYSVFMVAKSVCVTTRRYSAGLDKTLSLEFPKGITLSPILSSGFIDSSHSTCVRIRLEQEPTFTINEQWGFGNRVISELKKILPIIVVGLDVDVYYANEKFEKEKVHTNINSKCFDKGEWLNKISLDVIRNDDAIVDKLEIIKDENDEVRAIVGLPSRDDNFPFISAVNGLATDIDFNHTIPLVGFFNGSESSMSRNSIDIGDYMKNWCKEKYKSKHGSVLKDLNLCIIFSGITRNFKLDNDIFTINREFLYKKISDSSYSINSIDDLISLHFNLFVSTSVRPPLLTQGKMDFLICKTKTGAMESFNSLPMNSTLEILSKFCYILNLHPFYDGNFRVATVWLDFALYRYYNRVVNWKLREKKDFLERKDDPLCLQKFMEPLIVSYDINQDLPEYPF